ncbi:MAG: AAA family ATPase [Proteobacteria bacterium]|nr:AAA family ATPase [Pseudomonadota bacterium]
MLSTIAGYKVISELYRSTKKTLYQGFSEDTAQKVLIKAVNHDYPTIEEIARLRNEYQAIQKLQFPNVIKVLDLAKHGNGLTIVMEDFGGTPLINHIDNGLSLSQFFSMAIQMARSVEVIHKRRIIHKNITPFTVLWNPDSKEIRIADFEHCTELSQEQKSDQNPELPEDSLPYISPEQTGRMNRDVDYLTDYYSLGATFYEMLNGQHAFEAEDTMGWIYCHITKKPVELNTLNSDIPKTVSDIVLKLMEKSPENRYQSMQGLIKDLETCQRQWAKRGSIEPMKLGRSDYSDQFQIPQKLYGREGEIEALIAAFRKASRGRPELLLIAGFSGIGKSALVKEIRIPILQNKGYFIEGENDQLKRNQPYNALTQAFDGLIKRLLAEPTEKLESWKNALKEALEPNGQIILDIIPELQKIIGSQPPVQSLNPTEAQNRFLITFRKFVRVFATEEHPLVLFLDDLQWTDISTLDLITDLVKQENLHLLVIGSYRNNEVSDSHPLMLALDDIQKSKFIKRLFLKPLEETSVCHLIKEALHCPQKSALPLSELIFSKTGGNPFFVKELLKDLHKEEFIQFDYNKGIWHWDLENIRGLQVSDNVVHFVINRIKRLPEDTQNILELASCIGSVFDLKTLGLISKMSLPHMAKALWDGIEQGILIPLDDRYRLIHTQEEGANEELSDFGVTYKFAHDRIQQAFYSLLEKDRKQTVHLSIGRLMLEEFDASQVEQKLVDILFQLNEARSLIVEDPEKIELAKLNLTAGKRAKSSTAYQAAYQYLKTGLDSLPEDSWKVDYELTFEISKEFSECAYLCGEFKEADEHCQVLIKQSKTKLEKAEILGMQSLQYTITGDSDKAIEIGINALALLDIKISADPNKASIVKELLVAKFNLGSRSIVELANQPIVQDKNFRTSLKILIELGAPAYLSGKEQLFAMTVLKGVNAILKHGNAPEAPMCYIPFGYLLGSVVGDWKSGYEFGKLGLELNEKLNNLELKSRVIFFYTVFIHAWNRTWKSIPGFLKKAVEAGYQSGDLFYLAYSAVQIIPWDPDIDLETAVEKGEKYLAVIKESKYEDAWYAARIIQQLRFNLRGQTYDWLTLNSISFDETEYLKRNQKLGFVPGVALFHLYKLQISYTFEDYQSAAYHAEEAEQPMASMAGLPYTVEYCLYVFLSAVKEYESDLSPDKSKTWKRLKKEYRRMKKWADHCRENFSHHLLLMEAEMSRINGGNQAAIDCYNEAISKAQANGFLRYEALNNEMAAKFFLKLKQEKIASTYMRDALYCYNRWGAIAKCNQLRKTYPFLLSQADLQEQPGEIAHTAEANNGNDHIAIPKQAETLDLETISKASHTLSGEVVLEKLLNKLMYIARENAGAEKVILILKEEQSGSLLVQAESNTDDQTIVMQSQSLEKNKNLSVAIVQYVARSLESVVLKDAAREGDFIHDAYISQNLPKSILAMPIINQGILMGVLYLENNLATDAFTPERLKVLGVLSTQAAISIQNALLYRTMEQKVVERTREIKELLDNTGQGFLTFDEDFRVHKQYSKACELFFGKPLVDKTLNQEKGLDFIDLIIDDPKEREQLKKLFEAVITEKVSLDAISQFFPEEITVENRILSLAYKLIPASQPQLSNRVMVILTDITTERELAEQLEKDEERNNSILQIVKDRQGYLSFLKSFTTSFRNIENILKREPEDIDVDKLFRLFHTIKGGAANFGLNQLVSHAHDIESVLYEVRAGNDMLTIDSIYDIKKRGIQLEQEFRTLTADFGNFIPEEDTVYMESVYKVPHSKIAKHQQFLFENFGQYGFEHIQSSINDICKQPMKTVLRGFEISAQSLAKELGKRVRIESTGDTIEVLIDKFNHLFSSFIHLVRNSIDHGLEDVEERLQTEKPEVGVLKIDVQELDNNLNFVFEDDGRGMDENKIADIALKEKLVSEEWLNKASKQEKLDLVFKPGFSSKKDVSELSGRGVGMDVVKAVVEELSGSIELSTELGKGTRIAVTVPVE